MKKIVLFFALVLSFNCSGQTYIPMPTDSAIWRYRFYDIDYLTQVTDLMLFVNGEDTLIGGKTYHKIFSRYHHIFQDDTAALPPIVDVSADYPDSYYGGYREEDKKIYFLWTFGDERLIYDYNAIVGSHVPAYSGTATIISIDSIMLADGYHKRYNTDQTYFSPIEGIGSSAGLLPDLIDGSSYLLFLCYSRSSVTYIPPSLSTIPCTRVTPFSFYDSQVASTYMSNQSTTIYPNPATEILHIESVNHNVFNNTIYNSMGQPVWSERRSSCDVDISKWPRGVYTLRSLSDNRTITYQKVIIN